ncbi:MAG: hypothetical protein CSA20_01480 [Deltaproteobacteria bacterium]|nr:MAG: hypothetical protein CSB32_00805 [Desulfobacterales bacterium]PIE73756.1 MAG: hypothetical protein CSA20_01480 [Deltaproteobacteria bacterium]
MGLAEGLRNHGDTIVKKWVDYTLSTYASSDFFAKEKDRFANPIGGNIREALKGIFRLLQKGAEQTEYRAFIEQFISIRSVQEFTPSQAVAPLNAVKHITRDVFLADKERAHLVHELYDYEFAVDLLTLAAFDIYMQYRERIYKIRINEIKSGNHILTDSRCPSGLLAETDIVGSNKGKR